MDASTVEVKGLEAEVYDVKNVYEMFRIFGIS